MYKARLTAGKLDTSRYVDHRDHLEPRNIMKKTQRPANRLPEHRIVRHVNGATEGNSLDSIEERQTKDPVVQELIFFAVITFYRFKRHSLINLFSSYNKRKEKDNYQLNYDKDPSDNPFTSNRSSNNGFLYNRSLESFISFPFVTSFLTYSLALDNWILICVFANDRPTVGRDFFNYTLTLRLLQERKRIRKKGNNNLSNHLQTALNLQTQGSFNFIRGSSINEFYLDFLRLYFSFLFSFFMSIETKWNRKAERRGSYRQDLYRRDERIVNRLSFLSFQARDVSSLELGLMSLR